MRISDWSSDVCSSDLHAEAALDEVLAHCRAELAKLLASDAPPTWDSLIEPQEDMSDRIQRAWGPVSHLFSVNSTADWRQAYNACLPKLTEYGVEVSQSEPLFRAYEALAASDEYKGYDVARRQVIADALRDRSEQTT